MARQPSEKQMQRIHKAANALVAKGIEAPTNDQVLEEMGGGSIADVSPAMREWRKKKKQSEQVMFSMPDAVKNAGLNLLATDQGVYPRNDLEMSVFACLWFAIHGPFESFEHAKKSLPIGFITAVEKEGVSLEWIETVFNDEILHARHVERKEQIYLEGRESDD